MSKPCRFCTAPTHAGLFCCRNCWSRLPDPVRHAVYLARVARNRLDIDDAELARRWDEIAAGHVVQSYLFPNPGGDRHGGN